MMQPWGDVATEQVKLCAPRGAHMSSSTDDRSSRWKIEGPEFSFVAMSDAADEDHVGMEFLYAD